MEELITTLHRKIAALSAELKLMSESFDELYFIVVDIKHGLAREKRGAEDGLQ